MKTNLLICLSAFTSFAIFAQPTPFPGCPDVNLAVVRAGNNSGVTNPVYIYTVESSTGAAGLLSGPITDGVTANLQINGVGLNTVDGFLYGLKASLPSIPLSLPIIPAFSFYRIGINAQALQLGTLSGPPPVAPDNASIVNPAAGETDQSGNYYFSAVQGNFLPDFANPAASLFVVSKMYLGKLMNINVLGAGSGALSPSYLQITTTDPNSIAFLASVFTGFTVSNIQNTGLRDFVYNHFDNSLYTYVTFPDPLNPPNYFGQLLKLNPFTGVLTSIAPPAILPFANANNEVAGTFLDKTGSLFILFTSGDIYKADGAGGIFTGGITLLNDNPNLPSPLRGDMASCGNAVNGGPLAVNLEAFNVYYQNHVVNIQWQTGNEINADKFIVEKSTDGMNWSAFTTVAAKGNTTSVSTYQVNDNSAINKIVFYRLAMVDKDGSRQYSNIKKIMANSETLSFVTYPNPVKNLLTIETNQAITARVQVRILDAMGKKYNSEVINATANYVRVNVSNLRNGIYFVQLTNEKGLPVIQKFIKQ